LFENPFDADGKWYKGNLHTHTTGSDGAWSPDKVAAEYRAKGYNFLFITDHNTVTDVSGLSGDGLLVLNGTELGAGRSEIGHSYHIVALNLKETVSPKDAPTLQELIDLIKSKGAEVIVAHPYWSGLTVKDIIDLEGCLGVEVFNSTCHFSIAKGHSAVHWDDLLARGKGMSGFAVDDAHQHFSDYRPIDICYAWIMAKLPELTEDAVMSAIKAGRFYSSNGPTINDISVKDGVISVSTSDVKVISFVADVSRGKRCAAMGDGLINKADYKLRGSEKYIRVECFDQDGRGAWSNPIVFNFDTA
jgi:hypothetical protein